MVQRRDHPDHTWFIGKGKADELHELCLEVDADTVVFDNELSPAQQFNLEKLLGRTAIDRTAVILDIFAQNAHTLEGKAQVELALLRYRLPRLRRGATAKLSQQRGGVGTRFGGGETKLEVDRRRIMRRISKLEGELDELGRTRQLQRQQRDRSGLGAVTIVGYTNAGKSTLLNTLTDAGVLTEDRLFATLDPTTRRLALPGGEPVLLTDTVGFVRRLPHGLVESFKSTLEVASRADYLVHVVDADDVDPEGQIDAVREVLDEIDAAAVPELLVFNKADLAPLRGQAPVDDHPGSVAVSAVTGEGIDDFLRVLADRLRSISAVVELAVPYDRGDVLAAIHREGEVVSTTDELGRCASGPGSSDASAGRLAEFVVAAGWIVTTTAAAARPFVPPPYPYDRLERLVPAGRALRRAASVDLSIGTPMDPPPPAVVAALSTSGTERGYPPSIGTAVFRGAVARWIARRFGVDVPDRRHRRVRRHQGVRRHVAAVAAAAHARPRHRPVPGDVVPDLRDGGDPRRVPAGGRAADDRPAASTSAAIDPADAERALALWVNSPGNPTGGVDDLGAVAAWGRAARRAGVLRRVLRRVHVGRPGPQHPAARDSTASWPSTRCRSAPTSPACGSASTPAMPSSCTTSRRSASTSA